jgi:hypothetical protein
MEKSTITIIKGLGQDSESIICTKCQNPVGERSYLHQEFHNVKLQEDKNFHRECCGRKFSSQWKQYDKEAQEISLKNIPR